MATRVKETVWIVTDAETHGGGSIRAASPEAAFRKAVARIPGAWFRKVPKRIRVDSFAGQDHVSRHWFNFGG